MAMEIHFRSSEMVLKSFLLLQSSFCIYLFYFIENFRLHAAADSADSLTRLNHM